MSSQFTSGWQQIRQVSQIKTRDAGERPFWTVSVFDEKLENRSASDAKNMKSHCLTSWWSPKQPIEAIQYLNKWKEHAISSRLTLFFADVTISDVCWRKTTPPILCWHYTAQDLVAKRPQPPRSVISIIIYPIPSDLGSQDDSSQASSTVGDHVRSPGTERFYFSPCLIWRSTNTLIRSVFGRKIKASSNTFSPKILKRSVKGTWYLDCQKKLYFSPHFS